jgi:sugar O-acyltransferase (sialic acid O-acetyltransferase NeuD family)
MSSKLIIIGSGGHSSSVMNVAIACGYSVIHFVDKKKKDLNYMGIPLISINKCVNSHANENYFIAIGDNVRREEVYNEVHSLIPNAKFPSLMHPLSVIGLSSRIGVGSILMPGSHIGPNSKIGNFCIINTKASIDHDCNIKNFASLAPGVVTGGNVSVGKRSAIFIGSIIKHKISIGDDTVVGAASYVNEDIKNNVVAYGSPCKIIRNRKIGNNYLA